MTMLAEGDYIQHYLISSKNFLSVLLKIFLEEACLFSAEFNSFQGLENNRNGCLEVDVNLQQGKKKIEFIYA
jgi:hypothetical protein